MLQRTRVLRLLIGPDHQKKGRIEALGQAYGRYGRAVAARFFGLPGALPLEEHVAEVQGWLGKHRGDEFEIEIRRSYLSAGASAADAALLVTFLGGVASSAAWDGLLYFMRQTFAGGDRVAGSSLDWLLNEEPDDAANYLAGWISRALDRRRAEISLVHIERRDGEIRALYDVGDDQYEIRVDESAYRITRAERSAGGGSG